MSSSVSCRAGPGSRRTIASKKRRNHSSFLVRSSDWYCHDEQACCHYVMALSWFSSRFKIHLYKSLYVLYFKISELGCRLLCYQNLIVLVALYHMTLTCVNSFARCTIDAYLDEEQYSSNCYMEPLIFYYWRQHPSFNDCVIYSLFYFFWTVKEIPLILSTRGTQPFDTKELTDRVQTDIRTS